MTESNQVVDYVATVVNEEGGRRDGRARADAEDGHQGRFLRYREDYWEGQFRCGEVGPAQDHQDGGEATDKETVDTCQRNKK